MDVDRKKIREMQREIRLRAEYSLVMSLSPIYRARMDRNYRENVFGEKGFTARSGR